jgi:hypothetical protein
MNSGPDGGPMGPMGPNQMGPVLNGDGLDGMEDSGSGMGDYNIGGFGGPGENVSVNNSRNKNKNKIESCIETLYKLHIIFFRLFGASSSCLPFFVCLFYCLTNI